MRLSKLAGTIALAAMLAGCGKPEGAGNGGGAKGADDGKLQIAIMPKVVGIDYFSAVETGAREAAKEIGAELLWDGPATADVARQAEMLDSWIAQGVDVIAVAPNDPNALAPTLEKARAQGIKILTFDADSTEASRDYFVNQASSEAIAHALVDEMVAQVGADAETAIVTGSMTADNQNTWMKYMNQYIAEKHPGIKIVTVKPSEEDQALATNVTKDLIKAYPNLKGIFAITSVALPGAALGVEQSGKAGQIAVVGLATPKGMKQFVDSGVVKTVILWNPVDLGYLAVQVGKAIAGGEKLGDKIGAGRLGDKAVTGTQVLLGEPMKFTKENIGQFNF